MVRHAAHASQIRPAFRNGAYAALTRPLTREDTRYGNNLREEVTASALLCFGWELGNIPWSSPLQLYKARDGRRLSLARFRHGC